MSSETESDIRDKVSECFSHRESENAESAYTRLKKLLTETYGMHHWDADSLANTLEQVAAEYIMDYSPKFQDNDK